ncbi:MAG: L-threonine 3-dehydrogenase [Verrucomicrobiota bacterium]
MRAIVKKSPGPGLSLEEMPPPVVGSNDVLIQVLKTSICGTDVHIDQWDAWASKTIKPPMIIGHEFVGKIAAVGDNVQGYRVNDLVTGEGHLVCGQCRNCLAGRRHLCKNTVGVGVHRDGAFAEFIAIPAANVWHADPGIPTDILSCFDPLGNAVHTTLTYDVLGEDVLITGAGPIGCMAVAIAKHAGARHIVVTDINPYRLELARRMGATLAVDARAESLHDIEQRLRMKEGFDVALEMSGSPQALRDLIDVMIHGGKIALLGILPAEASIDWTKVIFNGLTIKGIYGRQIYETWYKTTTMLQSGLDIHPVITHRFHYSQFREAFDLMHSGRCGKIILEWGREGLKS